MTGVVGAEVSCQRQRELEHDAGRGQVLVRVGAPRLSRIEHGQALRHRPRWQVVVADDHIDAGGRQRAHGRVRVGAAVGRDHHPRPRRDGRPHAGARQVVPVFHAMRHERLHASAEGSQGASEDRRRCHAVDVVVAVHEDDLARCQRPSQSLDRRVQAQHQRRVVQLVEARRSSASSLLVVLEHPAGRHRRHARRQAKVFSSGHRRPDGGSGRIQRVGARGRAPVGVPGVVTPLSYRVHEDAARLADFDGAARRHQIAALQRDAGVAVAAGWGRAVRRWRRRAAPSGSGRTSGAVFARPGPPSSRGSPAGPPTRRPPPSARSRSSLARRRGPSSRVASPRSCDLSTRAAPSNDARWSAAHPPLRRGCAGRSTCDIAAVASFMRGTESNCAMLRS